MSVALANSDFSYNFGAIYNQTHMHTLTKKWKYTENQNLSEDPALLYIDQLTHTQTPATFRRRQIPISRIVSELTRVAS